MLPAHDLQTDVDNLVETMTATGETLMFKYRPDDGDESGSEDKTEDDRCIPSTSHRRERSKANGRNPRQYATIIIRRIEVQQIWWSEQSISETPRTSGDP
jgi:hypothetical protein